MTKPYAVDLTLIKASLTGSNFEKLLSKKKVTMWRVHKDCKISYQTLLNWKNGKTPSDDLAKRVAKYLGLINPTEAEILEIKKQQAELQKRIDRLLGER